MGAGVILRHQHSGPPGAGSRNAGSLELSGDRPCRSVRIGDRRRPAPRSRETDPQAMRSAMALSEPQRGGIRFNRNEWSGAFGDWVPIFPSSSA